MNITKAQARHFLLHYQRLLPPKALSGKAGVLSFFNKVRCVQYDPLNTAGRNADLVLQSRVKKYASSVLHELLYNFRSILNLLV